MGSVEGRFVDWWGEYLLVRRNGGLILVDFKNQKSETRITSRDTGLLGFRREIFSVTVVDNKMLLIVDTGGGIRSYDQSEEAPCPTVFEDGAMSVVIFEPGEQE